MKYVKVICNIKPVDLEIISNLLFDLGTIGTEIIDNNFYQSDFLGEIYPDKTEMNDETILIGYFESIDPRPIFDFINEHQIVCDIKIENLEEVDYESSWKDNYDVIELNDTISIVPSWYTNLDHNKIYLKIEPGQGFGTGHHNTTQLALINLIENFDNQKSLIDLGCGSGIIAILAKKLNVDTVYGLDLDEFALKNARFNAEINNCEINFLNIPLNKIDVKVDIIVANLTYSILTEHVSMFKYHLNKGGLLILSGLLENQINDMINQLKKNQYKIIKTNQKNNWASIVATWEE